MDHELDTHQAASLPSRVSPAPTVASLLLFDARPGDVHSGPRASLDVPSSRLLPLRLAIMNSAAYPNAEATEPGFDEFDAEANCESVVQSSVVQNMSNRTHAGLRLTAAIQHTAREGATTELGPPESGAGRIPQQGGALAPFVHQVSSTLANNPTSVPTSPKPHKSSFWSDTCQLLKLQQKVLSDIAARKQWILVLPLLLCLLLCSLGVFGVMLASQRYVAQQRAYAGEAMASATASTIAGQLEIATFAVMSISSYISQKPDCVELRGNYEDLANVILSWDANHVVYQLQALPAAVLQYIYPPVEGDLAKLLYGRDLLQVPQYRNDTLFQITRQERLLLGPYKLLEGFRAIFVSYPIFLRAPDELYDWNCGLQPYECPAGLCWRPDTKEKLWGIILGIISLDNMQESFRLAPIVKQGYRYALRQLSDEVNAGMVISATDPPPLHPVTATISKFNLVWVFEVSPDAGWQPAWRNPCIAAVVVGSVIVPALVFWLLVTRERHNMLLKAMLPRKVIQQLQRGEQTVVEEFLEPVTILFSDIVSYTEVASQLTPLQVVRLLNDLYTEFDALTDKHGVYKVETIGDAFMCVSGCPIAEDPVQAAVRMAGMAQDMIAVVSRFVSKVGGEELRVKIRIGLHSGPVVAGVIGQRMPRYCLFGDTVNTASRMESNSAPMCINVSWDTAKLLMAGGARVVPCMPPPREASPLSAPLSPPRDPSRGPSLNHIVPSAPSNKSFSALTSVPTAIPAGGTPVAGLASSASGRTAGDVILQPQSQAHPQPYTAAPAVVPLVLAQTVTQQSGGEVSFRGGWQHAPKVREGTEPLVLHSRGRINIKGKGMMGCFWLGQPPAPLPPASNPVMGMARIEASSLPPSPALTTTTGAVLLGVP